MAVNYGQVAIVPKGEWNVETQYKVNNLVSYDGSSYVAKVQPPVGTLPTDTSYWQVSAAGTKKATADSLGTVMPDGTTTSVGEDGKLSVNTAQQDALGVVKGSDDITVGEDGKMTLNTTFEQATELANIIAGEAIKSVLGKVSKAIAATMSLDENALLKNMISGIDVNDGNKVPSSAYIHSLVERIGMGTALEGGFDNLTAGLNSVNNNLSKLNGKMLGSNYVMNYSDFSDLSVNVYSAETFATTPSGNAPENNVGDFRITRLGMNNSKYNTLILTSPRYKTSVSMSQEFYVGNFWDGIWMGWERLANKSALDNLTSLYNTTKANYEKGSTFLDDISPLSFPSQLKHAGFYKLPTMTADVNADAGSETMTEYTTGDFYGLLLGEGINTTDGCVYGTLIVSSPRIKSAIWVGNIWQKKFISWYKIGKS